MNNEKKAPVRQIKFRAKQSHGVRKGAWWHGYFSKDATGTAYITTLDGVDTVIVDEYTLVQFTGKLTKSGTEIYDGDKLQQSKDCYWVVKWSDLNCGWNCYQYVFSQDEDGESSWKKSDTYPLGHSLIGLLTYNYEVIGNIHEESEVTNG